MHDYMVKFNHISQDFREISRQYITIWEGQILMKIFGNIADIVRDAFVTPTGWWNLPCR